MQNTMINCHQCNKIIKQSDMIYKLCDASLCSEDCQIIRYNIIMKIDPNLLAPQTWRKIKNSNDSIFINNKYKSKFKKKIPFLRKKSYSIITINENVNNNQHIINYTKNYTKNIIFIFIISLTLGAIIISILYI